MTVLNFIMFTSLYHEISNLVMVLDIGFRRAAIIVGSLISEF